MAHWIIDGPGFDCQYCKCSECGDSWRDIYNDYSSKEKCPSCGALIDEDETEYIQDKKKNKFVIPNIFDLITKKQNNDTLINYAEMDLKLKQLTGFDIEQLVDLFAAGYTLCAPIIEEDKLIDLVDKGYFAREYIMTADEIRALMKNQSGSGKEE